MSANRPSGVVVAALTVLAFAGAAVEAWGALTWDASLGGGVFVDDNLHFDPKTPVEEGRRQPVQETTLTVTPEALVSWGEGRDQLRLAYGGEYQRFSGDEERDPLWVHRLSAGLDWRRWSPVFLEAREERDRAPRSRERDTEAVVDQIDRNRALVRAGLARELGARGLAELAYRGELESYPGVEDADRVFRQYGEGLWRYRWSPLWQTELRAAYGWADRRLTADVTEARASAAVDQRLSERLALRYSLEWVREDADAATGPAAVPGEAGGEVRTTLLKAAALDGTLERGGAWRLAYEDSLEGLAEGDTLKTRRVLADTTLRARLGSSLRAQAWRDAREYRNSGREETAWGPLLAARWMIAPGVACDVAGSWSSTKIREPGRSEIEDRTGRVAAGVMTKLYDRLTLEAGYAFRKNDSDEALRSYESRFLYVLLTAHFLPVGGALPASYAAGLVASSTDAPGQAGAQGETAESGIGR